MNESKEAPPNRPHYYHHHHYLRLERLIGQQRCDYPYISDTKKSALYIYIYAISSHNIIFIDRHVFLQAICESFFALTKQQKNGFCT